MARVSPSSSGRGGVTGVGVGSLGREWRYQADGTSGAYRRTRRGTEGLKCFRVGPRPVSLAHRVRCPRFLNTPGLTPSQWSFRAPVESSGNDHGSPEASWHVRSYTGFPTLSADCRRSGTTNGS